MELRERYRGALVGLAVGDALGTTLEFERPGTFTPITGGQACIVLLLWSTEEGLSAANMAIRQYEQVGIAGSNNRRSAP